MQNATDNIFMPNITRFYLVLKAFHQNMGLPEYELQFKSYVAPLLIHVLLFIKAFDNKMSMVIAEQ